MAAFEVFVSYSRHDEPIVVPVVKLLRLGDHGMVFLDLDSIAPGDLWRGRLEEALASARYVVLFWCEHASGSREVEREYRAALATGKALVPVLLDRTPLPPGLSEHQWIDLSALAIGTHRPDPPPPPAPRPATIPDDWDPFAIDPARPVGAPDLADPLGRPEPAPADLDALFGLSPAQARPAAPRAQPSASIDAMATQLRDELLRRARQEGLE